MFSLRLRASAVNAFRVLTLNNTTDIHAHRILILDFGSQYTQLIARRVREIGVYCEILPWDMPEKEIRAFGPRGIILSGGPASVLDEGAPDLDRRITELGKPVLGICYGLQALVHRLGGLVEKADDREYGRALLEIVSVAEPCPSRLASGSPVCV